MEILNHSSEIFRTLFPTHILVKDYDLSDTFTENITAFCSAILKSHDNGKNSKEITENSLNLFSEENKKLCPELAQLLEMFLDSFLSLANNYPGNKLTREKLLLKGEFKGSDKVPFMKKGDYKSAHTHGGATSAFGIFYLDDVNNEIDGGHLLLHDPRFTN